MARRSTRVLRLIAESTPMAMPTVSQRKAAPTISESVRGAFSMILERIDTFESYEKPRPGQPYLSPVTIALQELAVLDVPRPVEAEVVAHERDALRGRLLAGEAQRGVSRRQEVEDREGDGSDRDEHCDRPRDTAGEVEEPSGMSRRRPGHLPGAPNEPAQIT